MASSLFWKAKVLALLFCNKLGSSFQGYLANNLPKDASNLQLSAIYLYYNSSCALQSALS